MAAKLRIGFGGRRDGLVARALAPLAELHDYDPAAGADAFDVVMIDAGSTVRLDDPKHLADLIAAGVSVGWVDPDPATLDAVETAFGARFEAWPGLLLIADIQHLGQRRRRVETVGGQVPDQPVRLAVQTEAGAIAIRDATLHPAAAADLAERIARAAVRDWKAALPAATEMVPPNGATYSVTQYTHSCPSVIDGTGWSDGGSTTQSIDWSSNVTAYQYYANGNGGNDYVVILVGGFTAAPGTIANNDSDCRNWIQTQVSTQLAMAPFTPTTVSNTLHSPPSSSGGIAPVVETVSAQMSFQIQGAPVAWTANYANSYFIPDWAMTDQSNVGTGVTEWLFYETTQWNPVTDPPGDFSNWWSSMYGKKDRVCTFPAASLTNLNVDVAGGWNVAGNPGNAGPLRVIFQFGLNVGYYAFANPKGTGDKHHQIMYFVDQDGNPVMLGVLWSTIVDLVATT